MSPTCAGCKVCRWTTALALNWRIGFKIIEAQIGSGNLLYLATFVLTTFCANRSPAEDDGASAVCSLQLRESAFGLSTSYILLSKVRKPQIPARLGAISRVIATYRITL